MKWPFGMRDSERPISIIYVIVDRMGGAARGLVGAAKASYGHSMLRYAVSIRRITPISIDRFMYSIHYTILAWV